MSSSEHDGTRPALARAQLVEHAVLRHLEEPGRELRAEREPREPLEDPEEDLLRQILGERPIADEPEDVVEDGRLVRAQDERNARSSPRWAFRSTPDQAGSRAPGGAEYSCPQGLLPVISAFVRVSARPRRREHVGARSASCPPSRAVTLCIGHHERDRIRRVRGVRADAVRVEHLLGVAVVGGDEATPPAARPRRRPARGSVDRLDRLDRRRDRPGVPDHVRVGEVDDGEAVAALARSPRERSADLARRHLGLEVVARDVARGGDEDPRLARPLAPRGRR